jgi:NitT/TauT family transport system permease protein
VTLSAHACRLRAGGAVRDHPRTQPYLFASSKMAITLAFIGTVVSETIAANAGPGFLMVQVGSNFQMPLVFAGLLLLAVEGIAIYAIFASVESHFTRWTFRSSISVGIRRRALLKFRAEMVIN